MSDQNWVPVKPQHWIPWYDEDLIHWGFVNVDHIIHIWTAKDTKNPIPQARALWSVYAATPRSTVIVAYGNPDRETALKRTAQILNG